jgi:DNA-binding CsgD family transcriptional regulator
MLVSGALEGLPSTAVRELFDCLSPTELEALATAFPDIVPLEATSDAGRRSSNATISRETLVHALVSVTSEIMKRLALVALIDDIQLFDRSSLAFFGIVTESFAHRRYMVVITARDTDPATTDEVRTMLARYIQSPLAHHIELTRFSKTDIVALGDRRGVPVSPEAAEEILSISSGNPLLAEQLLWTICHDPGFRKAGKWRAALEQRGVDALAQVLESRVWRLSARARTLLHRAAALGRSFSVADLEAVSPPSGSILPSLGEIEQLFLIRPAAPGEYEFVHDMIREATIAHLTSAERCGLFEEVAFALEESLGDTADTQASRLSGLFVRGASRQSRDRMIHYARVAMNDAFARLAFEEAIASAELILDHADVSHGRNRSEARSTLQAARQQLSDADSLTAREHVVLRHVSLGLADKEIASELGVSPFTVNKHVAKILHKLGAASRTEAVFRAREIGILG